MPSKQYTDWISSVRAAGGRVVVPATGADGFNPNTGKTLVPKVPSAAYDSAVYVPKVNKGVKNGGWPLPDEYSANGSVAYYHAPLYLQDEIKQFGQATKQEIKTNADRLMDQWGVPFALRGLGQYFSSLGLIALVAVGAYLVVTGKVQGHRSVR